MKVKQVFVDATFVTDLGIRLEKIEPGRVETSLEIQPRHAQQHGFVHAGVLATMADHTAGGAAVSMSKEDDDIMSIEFKINFLRPATGKKLRCVGTCLKPGRTIFVSEAEIFDDQDKLVAKATVTLAAVQNRNP
jgi:uncharacterized protein (TIGR00369 family)